MKIPNLGRLIGAGLLALGLHALSPGMAASNAGSFDTTAGSDRAAPSSSTFKGAHVGAQAALSPAGGRRSTENQE